MAAVGFTVNKNEYLIGTSDFLHSFFSTIAYNLERKDWGSRYPYLMNELYMGELKKEHVQAAIKELDTITAGLKNFKPDRVIWDIEDLSKQPPWGKDISSDITDLSNYFITYDGEDLISVLRDALVEASKAGVGMKIEKF